MATSQEEYISELSYTFTFHKIKNSFLCKIKEYLKIEKISEKKLDKHLLLVEKTLDSLLLINYDASYELDVLFLGCATVIIGLVKRKTVALTKDLPSTYTLRFKKYSE